MGAAYQLHKVTLRQAILLKSSAFKLIVSITEVGNGDSRDLNVGNRTIAMERLSASMNTA